MSASAAAAAGSERKSRRTPSDLLTSHAPNKGTSIEERTNGQATQSPEIGPVFVTPKVTRRERGDRGCGRDCGADAGAECRGGAGRGAHENPHRRAEPVLRLFADRHAAEIEMAERRARRRAHCPQYRALG